MYWKHICNEILNNISTGQKWHKSTSQRGQRMCLTFFINMARVSNCTVHRQEQRSSCKHISKNADSCCFFGQHLHKCVRINVAGPGSKIGCKRKTLGEQTVLLTNTQDRLVALRRTTAAMQVLLARSVIMKALSLLSIRWVGVCNYIRA